MNRVVVGVAPRRPRPELVAWAAAEATARRSVLELVTACPAVSDTSVSGAAVDWAASLAAEGGPELTVVTQVISGRPEHVLRTAAAGADLLVIGGDDQNPFAEAITGSIPGALLTTAPCPIVVVPKGAAPVDGGVPVLAGVDTAANSRAALAYSFAVAARTERALQVVLCWDPPRDRTQRQAELVEQQRALSIALAGYAEHYPDVAVTELLIAGDPVEELARRSRRAALLVLGSRGRGRLASLAFGSASRTLVRRSQCPVAIVRPGLPAANDLAS